KSVEQITHYTDFDVRSIDSDGSTLAFDQGGRIHLLDAKTNAEEARKVNVPNDGLAALPRWEDAKGSVRDAAIAPNGKRAVFEARGEIITVPREHGDARNLT